MNNYKGRNPTSSIREAKGIWTLNDQYKNRSENTWPIKKSVLTYITGGTSTTQAASYTNNINVGGTPVYLIGVYAYRTTSTSLSSPTINSVAATKINSAYRAGSAYFELAICISSAKVSGSSVPFVVSGPVMQRFLYACYSLSTDEPNIIDSFKNPPDGATQGISVTLTSGVADGIGIAAALGMTNNTITGVSIGSGPVTSNYNSGVIATANALIVGTVTGSGNIVFNASGSSQLIMGCLAQWR